jgi:hypothetical protein
MSASFHRRVPGLVICLNKADSRQRRGFGGAKHPQKVRLAPPEKFLLAPPSPQAKSNFWTKCILLQGNTESIKVILPVNLLEDNENCSFVWKKFMCCVLFIIFA